MSTFVALENSQPDHSIFVPAAVISDIAVGTASAPSAAVDVDAAAAAAFLDSRSNDYYSVEHYDL